MTDPRGDSGKESGDQNGVLLNRSKVCDSECVDNGRDKGVAMFNGKGLRQNRKRRMKGGRYKTTGNIWECTKRGLTNPVFFFFFWDRLLCVSGYRTPCSTSSSMYRPILCIVIVLPNRDTDQVCEGLCTTHQENPLFAFWCFFYFFGAFHEKCRKSMKKPSPLLARVLSKAVKKVHCFQKYSRSQKYIKVQPKNNK